MSMTLTSPSFKHKGDIPERYTCDGPNVSPPLEWSGVPTGTKSLALIVEDPDAPDPDAPRGTWVHWVLYDVSPEMTGLPEGMSAGTNSKKLHPRELEGVNDWKHTGYQGPCPPKGKHRYFFKLYALDVLLADMGHPAKAALERAMRGRVIDHAELIGLYQRHA
jgi:Raf kinase inhibitor-like YbhB/YbcL family protein